MLGNHTKGNFGLRRAFLGKSQQLVRWLFNQILSFRMGKHQSFLIHGQLTFMLYDGQLTLMLYMLYKIHSFLMDGTLNPEVVLKFRVLKITFC